MTNTNTGYTTRPVGSLSIADLLEEALQAADSAGHYAATDQAYSFWHNEAIQRRNACFEELKRRLEAYRKMAEACHQLLKYRRQNTLNFQLCKADDFHRLIELALGELEPSNG